MQQALFPPLGRPISRVVLGTFWMAPALEAETFASLDAWLSLGGNVVDTAQAYGDGDAERALGRYLESTGRRRDLVILTKGCHPIGDDRPRVTPEAIHADLSGSLDRLRCDVVDIYMLHRDDPSVEVGPIVEALNEELARRRILSFGASNWLPARIEEADDFAARHGLSGFTSSSSQLSLAVQQVPMCDGCLSAHADADLDAYARSGLSLFAWAALAQGFFSDGLKDDPDVERIYGSAANRERSRRAQELGERLGLTRSQVALAWVLRQRFPTYAVVATRRLQHLDALAAASEVVLDERQVAWLDLVTDTLD
jgi:aryl-alcohol dehydrogenase-like predicted oxidoreductase